MAEIKLKAILRAYSKTPFYNDFVRDVSSQDGALSNIQYVRDYKEILDENGKVKYVGSWVPLDKALLDVSLDEYKNEVAELKTNVGNILVDIDKDTNQLIFKNALGVVTHKYLPQAKTDDITIRKNSDNNLYVVSTPDGETLKETNIIYENGVDENGDPKPNISGVVNKISSNIRVEGIYVNDDDSILSGNTINSKLTKLEKSVQDLEAYTQGTGGFLDPYNFEYSLGNLSQESKNTLLNQEAYKQLSNGVAQLIPDQTKIKNLFDGHIWVYIQKDNNWIDEGADTIVNANNEGVLGAVTGVAYNPEDLNTKFKISIVQNNNIYTGEMQVNGLQEEFDQVIYKNMSDTNPNSLTYVQRTTEGQIKASEPVEENDVVTLKYLNSYSISKEDIDSLFTTTNSNT